MQEKLAQRRVDSERTKRIEEEKKLTRERSFPEKVDDLSKEQIQREGGPAEVRRA
jgi:hypothetical protein